MDKPVFGRRTLWLLMTLLPLGVCYLLYAAYTSGLMVNFIAYMAYSLVVSIVCIVLLVFLKRIDPVKYKRKKWVRVWILSCGTPIIHVLTWLYFTLFVLSFQWSQTIVGDYTLTKYQNFFRAKFYYFNEKGGSDTIVITVNRESKIKSVVKVKLGKESYISEQIIDSTKELSKLNILKY